MPSAGSLPLPFFSIPIQTSIITNFKTFLTNYRTSRVRSLLIITYLSKYFIKASARSINPTLIPIIISTSRLKQLLYRLEYYRYKQKLRFPGTSLPTLLTGFFSLRPPTGYLRLILQLLRPLPIYISGTIFVLIILFYSVFLRNIISVKAITLKSYRKDISISSPAIVYLTDIINRIIIAIISVLKTIIRILAEIRNADVAAGAVIKVTIKIIISLKTKSIKL